MRKKYSQQGFSLLEIMVVIVIIGMLATVVTMQVMGFLTDSRQTTAKAQMAEFLKALNFYKMDKGSYPSSGQGLKSLLKKRRNGEPYLKDIPQDPWGNEYRYRSSRSKCEIISYGADGREGGEGADSDIRISSHGGNNRNR